MEWKVSQGLIAYEDALAQMRERVELIKQGEADELVWLLEHPPLYTAGTSAKAQDLLAKPFPVYETGRGGQYTYHGPGQRVVYVMMDLKKRAEARGKKPDLRQFVQQLEGWLIATLAAFGIEGSIREGRVGVWVKQDSGFRIRHSGREYSDPALSQRSAAHCGVQEHGVEANAHTEAKIAALGVRCEKWVTSHGVALNVHPDLRHYAGIVPCGISQFGVTSMHAMGMMASLEEVDVMLRREFVQVFGED